MPDPVVNSEPEDSPEAQRKLLEQIVGDLPAFQPGIDTGQGVLAPEGQEATAFFQSFNPPAQAVAAPNNGRTAVSDPQTQAPLPLQPAQAPAPAAPQPQSSGRLLAGKYRSVEEMERGYGEAYRELESKREEIRVLKAASLAAERIGGFRQPREAPTPPTEIPVQFRGEQPVVPVSGLREELLQAARTAAQETVTGILTPMQQLGSANATVRASYPEFAQQEGQFTTWLRDNPRYQGLIQNDPEVGLESAYLKFARDTSVQQVQQATQATHAAQQQVEQARSQAAPAGNTSPGSRRPTENESRWAELQRLYKIGQETGNFKEFNKARISFALGEQFMNTLDRTSWGR